MLRVSTITRWRPWLSAGLAAAAHTMRALSPETVWPACSAARSELLTDTLDGTEPSTSLP